jgi:O-antigen/teichoic acid export membrane protein
MGRPMVKRAWMPDASAEPLLDFLLRGSFASFMTRVVGVALSYVSAVLLSRLLGVSGYGVYSIALGWALVLVLPSRAGLDYAALRFGSVYLEEGSTARLRGFFRFSACVVFGVSAVAGAFLFLVTKLGLTSMRPSMAPGVGLFIFPIAALGLVGALLRTARKIAAGQFYDQIMRPAGLIAGLAAAALAGINLSPANAMVLTAAGAFIALLFAVVHVARATGALRGAADYSPWRSWLALSFPLLLTSAAQELLNQLDIIILGYLQTPQAAGLYSAAWRLASLIVFGLSALSISSGPLVAAAHARKDIAELARVARITARFGFVASAMLAVPLLVFGRSLLELFGPEFGAGYPALAILVAGGMINAFTGVLAYFLTLTGRQAQALWIFIGALAISCLLNLLLIPGFSIVGAAVASTGATLFWNVVMWVVVRRSLGIDSSALALAPRSR